MILLKCPLGKSTSPYFRKYRVTDVNLDSQVADTEDTCGSRHPGGLWNQVTPGNDNERNSRIEGSNLGFVHAIFQKCLNFYPWEGFHASLNGLVMVSQLVA